jgi:hypothetical protein
MCINSNNNLRMQEINVENTQALNEDLLLFTNTDRYEKEAKWIICFFKTDASLAGSKRCEIACELFKNQQGTVK